MNDCDHNWRWSKVMEYPAQSKVVLAMWGFDKVDGRAICKSCGEEIMKDED